MLPQLVPHSVPLAAAVIVGAFFILTYSANFLVDGAVGVAFKLRISKIVIGIVLVGFATTSPELAVSLLAAINGKPEIALGNAVGSVIVDDALALALGIIVAPVALKVDSRVLRTTGLFLIAVAVASFLLAGPIAVPGRLNGCSGGATACVGRIEGFALIATYFVYIGFVVRHERRTRRAADSADSADSAAAVADGASAGGGAAPAADESNGLAEHVRPGGVAVQLGWLGVGVLGVIIASEFLVQSAEVLAEEAGASPAIIGLTVIAIGTSLPEIATNIAASRRGHGDLALGNILGADILNILWIIGASAMANPIQVEREVVGFSFPWMLGVVALMLLLARHRHRLDRWKGWVLASVYVVYLALTVYLFFIV
ncbi:MAG: hypothetical protein CL878_00025 [Dehalococcoidia bacterium]|nr:hypothetical protein [Dehalococcoidia bacterium]